MHYSRSTTLHTTSPIKAGRLAARNLRQLSAAAFAIGLATFNASAQTTATIQQCEAAKIELSKLRSAREELSSAEEKCRRADAAAVRGRWTSAEDEKLARKLCDERDVFRSMAKTADNRIPALDAFVRTCSESQAAPNSLQAQAGLIALVCTGAMKETVLREDQEVRVSTLPITLRYTLDLNARRVAELLADNERLLLIPSEVSPWGKSGETRPLGTPRVSYSPDPNLINVGQSNHIQITHSQQIQINQSGSYMNVTWRALIDRATGKLTYSGVGTAYFGRFLGARHYFGTGECTGNGRSSF